MESSSDIASHIKAERLKKEYNENKISGLNKEGSWAAVGFAVVLIAFGLPIWWRTTTVYRAPLPYSAIQGSVGIKRQHYLPVTVLTNDHKQGSRISSALERGLMKSPGVWGYCVQRMGCLCTTVDSPLVRNQVYQWYFVEFQYLHLMMRSIVSIANTIIFFIFVCSYISLIAVIFTMFC